MTVTVLENTDKQFHLVLPHQPTGELSENDLEAVAGGRGGIQEPRASSEMAGGSVW